MLSLERAIATLPPGKIETSHHFSPGIYARELFIPKGCVLTGKIHRHAHLNILAQGVIVVRTEDGETKTLTAPAIIPSLPGVKRAGYALEDSTWITIHATDETDLEKLEDLFIVTDVAEWEALATAPRLVPRDDWSECPIVEEGIEE